MSAYDAGVAHATATIPQRGAATIQNATLSAAPAAAIRAHEELFTYWTSLRDGARLPARRDLDPAGMKRLLPTVSLIDVARRDPMDFRVRLAGTGLYSVYGCEITGKSLYDIYSSGAADYWRGELGKVIAERRPTVGVHNLAWRGASHLSILWLRLPHSIPISWTKHLN